MRLHRASRRLGDSIEANTPGGKCGPLGPGFEVHVTCRPRPVWAGRERPALRPDLPNGRSSCTSSVVQRAVVSIESVRSRDTSPEAHEVQLNLLRSMSPGRRMEMAVEISETVLAFAAGGIRSRHPEYDNEQIDWALRRMRLGDQLFRRAWPSAPLLEP